MSLYAPLINGNKNGWNKRSSGKWIKTQTARKLRRRMKDLDFAPSLKATVKGYAD